MRFIYGLGRTRDMEFEVAFRREAVPEGAEVYAVCDGALTVWQLDEHAFAAMTDEEFFTLRDLIRESERAEAADAPDAPRGFASLLQRLGRRARAALGASAQNA